VVLPPLQQRYKNERDFLSSTRGQIKAETEQLRRLKAALAELDRASQPQDTLRSQRMSLYQQVSRSVGNYKQYVSDWEKQRDATLQAARGAGQTLPKEESELSSELRVNLDDFRVAIDAVNAAASALDVQQAEERLRNDAARLEFLLGDLRGKLLDDAGLKAELPKMEEVLRSGQDAATRVTSEQNSGRFRSASLPRYRVLESGVRSLQKIDSAALQAKAGSLPAHADFLRNSPQSTHGEQDFILCANGVAKFVRDRAEQQRIREQSKLTNLGELPWGKELRQQEIRFAVSRIFLELESVNGKRSPLLTP
jgi:hypothetical protein